MTPEATPIPATMTALRAHHRGGPDQLVVETAPRPDPAPGELLVEVHAAAITFAELTWDESWTRDGLDRTPVIPSHEFSGAVVTHGPGPGPNAPAVGSEIFGLVPFDRDGAAADFVVVPSDNVAVKPVELTHVQAAALPVAAATAWQALVHHGVVGKGDRVLVHGGAGGVGAFAIQIAVALGAEVTTTVQHGHLDFVRGLGAHRVVDVDAEAFDDPDQQYDIVVDTVGGELLRRSFGALRRGGRLITLQAPPDAELARQHGVEAVFFIVAPDHETLAGLARLAEAGQLRIAIAATYPLTEGPAAYQSGQVSPRPPGKTVLVVR